MVGHRLWSRLTNPAALMIYALEGRRPARRPRGEDVPSTRCRRTSRLPGTPSPATPGSTQTYSLPGGAKRYVAIRAVDDQGNVGRPLVVDLGSHRPRGSA